MMGDVAFLAALSSVDLQGPVQPLGKAPFLIIKDGMLIVMLALALGLAFMLWAKYLRKWKPKKRHDEGRRVYRDNQDASGSEREEEEEVEAADDTPPSVRRKYKYRYRRRGHRARNPTLAETGGLPPARTGERSEPSA